MLATVEQLSKEASVYHKKFLQAGEKRVNDARLQLHLVQHAPPENSVHDAQRAHVMQLCLDQL